MTTTKNNFNSWRTGVLIVAAMAFVHSAGFSDTAPVASQKTFANPKDAVEAVLQACKKNDTDALLALFGPDGKDIVISGDPKEDQYVRNEFVKNASEKINLIPATKNPDKLIVSIGKDDWPFPVPLVKNNGQWSFDSAAGEQEILARRIGSNEMNAIEICRAYVEAQFEYAQDHKTNGLPEYAQKINSSPGRQDGLYWEPSKDAPECPVPKGFAKAAARMSSDGHEPYRGYFFHVLTAQGPDAHGGTINYIVNGSMIGGFALVAFPAEYGVSGVQTFVVNHDGTVFEADLGDQTGRIAAEMTEFDPDKTWQPVQSE